MPVRHGFCNHPLEYGWSSYLTCISDRATKLKRQEVVKLFGNRDSFTDYHKQKINTNEIELSLK